MQETGNGGGKRIGLALVLGLVFAVANAAVLVRITSGDWSAVQALPQGVTEPVVASLTATWQTSPDIVAYLLASPLLLALLLGARRAGTQTIVVETKADAPKAAMEPPGRDALRLLRLLQGEARFVDFVREDIDDYDDAQVGAAARSIHAGCRKALEGRITLRRIYDAEEGAEVVVEAGFDPAEVRLTGNFSGAPPFKGVLQHAGWHVTEVALPESPGNFDNSIIAPAEVEIT